ncbi:hypothetical protein IMSAGC011_01863 [Lachnospiraceae bacterium]|jgi:uncharacterized protein YukE|nr:hypothetical protein IMSAGC011_01863 [Lachnospiraceae bacterium]HBV82878.1 hypothetical protein [Lachnospiraceae bacterium]
MAKGSVVSGTIETEKIQRAHETIKQLVSEYKDVNFKVEEITHQVKENWVGKGLNEFEHQYKTLIKKIDDFGDTLIDIYEALVQAQGEYDTADDNMRQAYKMSMDK